MNNDSCYCHLELFLDNFPQIRDTRRNVAHHAVNTGNVRGIDLLVP